MLLLFVFAIIAFNCVVGTKWRLVRKLYSMWLLWSNESNKRVFIKSHINFILKNFVIVDCSINVHENSCKEQSPMCDKNRNSIRVKLNLILFLNSFLFVLALVLVVRDLKGSNSSTLRGLSEYKASHSWMLC